MTSYGSTSSNTSSFEDAERGESANKHKEANAGIPGTHSECRFDTLLEVRCDFAHSNMGFLSQKQHETGFYKFFPWKKTPAWGFYVLKDSLTRERSQSVCFFVNFHYITANTRHYKILAPLYGIKRPVPRGGTRGGTAGCKMPFYRGVHVFTEGQRKT